MINYQKIPVVQLRFYLFSCAKALVVILFLFLSPILAQAQLSGNYTIGGNSPDYTSFADAVSDIHKNGINGDVNFTIHTGIYDEQIKIDAFTGNGLYNITFQSATANANDVILKHKHQGWSTSWNYTIYLDGASNMTFKNITIEAELNVYNDYNRVLYITNSSSKLTFENNIIKSWKPASSYFNYNDCIVLGTDYAGSTEFDTIVFRGNTIIGGYIGLMLGGGEYANSRIVENNTFSGQQATGLYVASGKNNKVINNRFYALKPVYFYSGIEAAVNNDSLIIDRNYLRIHNGMVGISLKQQRYGSSKAKRVSNNMIVMTHDTNYIGTQMGIMSEWNDSLLIAHNSVFLNTDDTTGYCVYSANKDTLLLYNNQFLHGGGGKVYYFENKQTADYNNLYNGKNKIATISNVTYDSLSVLYIKTGLDQHSVSVDPQFLNDTLLIPFNAAVYDAGTPVATVKLDYFGNKRSTTKPDIGMYEGAINAIDAGLVNSNLLNKTYCRGDSIPFYVTLRNFGTQPLASAEIFYGTPDTVFYKVKWSGKLNKWEEADSIYLGKAVFNGIERANIMAWVANPNGLADANAYNDTIKNALYLPLSGVYTIGKDSSDYNSVDSALAALKKYGICGPVTFNIKAGKYGLQLILPEIKGASTTNTITFQSAGKDSTDVTFYVKSNYSYIFKLKGAKYFVFKHIAFDIRGYIDCAGVLLEDGAKNNTFISNRFIGPAANGNFSDTKLVYGYGENSGNAFLSNRFTNANSQLSLVGYFKEVHGGSIIRGNIFEGPTKHSLGVSYQSDVEITNNEFTGYRYSGCIGLYSCAGNILFAYNKINIKSDDALTAIAVAECYGTDSVPIIFANNFIASKSKYYTINLTLKESSHIKLLNNSFNALNFDGGGNIQLIFNLTYIYLYNNIYQYKGNSNGAFYSHYFNLDTSHIYSDYNVFYGNNAKHIHDNGTNISLTSWQNKYGLDTNSLFTNPIYVSDSNLHINNASALNGAGMPLAEVTMDIDGDPRDSIKPDIGADEFIVESERYHDVYLYKVISPDTTSCKKIDSLIVEVINKSSFNIVSFDSEVRLFDRSFGYKSHQVNMAPADTVRVNLGYFPMAANTLYDFRFELTSPNGWYDNYSDDNILQVKYHHLNNIRIYEAEREDCSTGKMLYIKDVPHTSIKWSTGATGNTILIDSPGTYSVTVTDSKGCKSTNSITIQ